MLKEEAYKIMGDMGIVNWRQKEVFDRTFSFVAVTGARSFKRQKISINALKKYLSIGKIHQFTVENVLKGIIKKYKKGFVEYREIVRKIDEALWDNYSAGKFDSYEHYENTRKNAILHVDAIRRLSNIKFNLTE